MTSQTHYYHKFLSCKVNILSGYAHNSSYYLFANNSSETTGIRGMKGLVPKQVLGVLVLSLLSCSPLYEYHLKFHASLIDNRLCLDDVVDYNRDDKPDHSQNKSPHLHFHLFPSFSCYHEISYCPQFKLAEGPFCCRAKGPELKAKNNRTEHLKTVHYIIQAGA
jgi:hypothetical protein